jgi:hypothetical protein
MLVFSVVTLVACADNPLDPHALRHFPPDACVDVNAHLSPEDTDQIIRLVGKQTAQRIDGVERHRDNTVEVTCGHWDPLSDGQRLYGNEYALRKVGAQWVIVDRGYWMQ